MNNRTRHILFLGVSIFLLWTIPTLAQISQNDLPKSFALNQRISENLPITSLPKVDRNQLIKEDQQTGRNFRFAAPIPVDYDLNNAGQWTVLKNGDRIWQLQLKADKAVGLSILYDDFFLPKGATLHVYNEAKTEILGAYTHINNKTSGKFMTGIIHSDVVVIEYFEPQQVKNKGRIHIHKLMYGYDRARITPPKNGQPSIYSGGSGFGTALPCHVNVNCAEGNAWENEKRSVVRILVVVEEGMGWCSGTLINNTRNDGTPYILSAFHCQDGFTPEYDFYRFDFHYESDDCNNPSTEPMVQSILGCTNRAGRVESDFQLFELSTDIPLNYNVFYSGWNRNTNYEPAQSWNIHHPNGDIKKISVDEDPAKIYPAPLNWNNNVTTPANHHFFVTYDEGTFEGGSSGSPLFDANGHVVGQLNGGTADCSIFEAFFGRFAFSWDMGGNANNQLQNWLDPENLGNIILDGFDPLEETNRVSISGRINDRTGMAAIGTTVYLYDQEPSENVLPIDSTTVSANGNYVFESLVSNQDYYVQPQKQMDDIEGVSTFDLVLMTQHILAINTLGSPYEMLAADVNQDGNITTFDVILTRQRILLFIDTFTNVDAWQFANADYIFTNNTDPFSSNGYEDISFIELQAVATNQNNINFIAYKMGDASGDASMNN